MKELEAWAYQHVGNTAAEDELWDIVGRLIAAERSECGAIADAEELKWIDTHRDESPHPSDIAERIAAAIRAGGQTT